MSKHCSPRARGAERTLCITSICAALLSAACSAETQHDPAKTRESESAGAGGAMALADPASAPGLMPNVPALQSGGVGGAPPSAPITRLPAGFTPAEGAKNGDDSATPRGGYRLVGPLALAADPSATACANVLRVLIRDFATYAHPDFGGAKSPESAPGLVLEESINRKPSRSTLHSSVALQFEDWYANVPGTNVPYLLDLWLEPVDDMFVFDSSRFFPLDSVDTNERRYEDDDGSQRNFGFTAELHTQFVYRGGEIFTFRGDDDVFVFIDQKLAVDLGGVHFPASGSVNIDELGLTVGKVYDLDLFQAERNPTGSNFRIETTLVFTNCGEILPTDVVK